MASVTQRLQEQLDAGYTDTFDSDGTELDWPLFINRSGIALIGQRFRSPIVAKKAGTALVLGYPRKGKMTAGHFPASGAGFRTCGDAHLMAVDTDYDLGPGTRGWPGVTRFQVELQATLHSPATWDNLPIMGICGDTSEDGGPIRPAPWAIWCGPGKLYVGVKTTDPSNPAAPAVRRLFSALMNTGVADLADGKLTVVIEPAVPRVRILFNNVEQPVSLSEAGPDWKPGLKFAENNDWPFKIGSLDAYMLSDRGLATRYDATFKFVNFLCTLDTGGSWVASGNLSTPLRGAGNAPEYPLATLASRNGLGTKYLWAVHDSQKGAAADQDNVNDIFMQDLELVGQSGNPLVMFGRVQGGNAFNANRVVFKEGSSGLGTFRTSTVYQLAFSDCNFFNNEIRGFCLTWGTQVDFQRSPVNGGSREFGRFQGCSGTYAAAVCTPPPGGMPRSFAVVGGRMSLERLNPNFEGQATVPAVVDYSYRSLLIAAFQHSGVTLSDTPAGGQPGHNAGPQVHVSYVEPSQHGAGSPIPSITVVNGDYREQAVTFANPADASRCRVLKVGELNTPIPGGS